MIADLAGSPMHAPDDLMAKLVDPTQLEARQARTDRLLAAEGAGHLVHDLPVRADGRLATIESRPWRVDPIPVVLDAPTFRWLSLAVAERMEALELVLADLYGERRLVRERIVPAELLAATTRYRVNAVGSNPGRWLTTYAVDLALDATGVWSVVQDLTDAPPGIGYALLDRSVMSRALPDVVGSVDIAAVSRFPGVLRRALASASPAPSPRIVLFSGGLDHPSYVDHSFLAVQLGVNLVEGADLVVRQRKVWLRTLDGLEPVDLLYRRLEDATIDPLEIASHGSVGVPGLLQAVRSGGVTLANAHGAGVVEAIELQPLIDAAIERLHPMEQLLPRLADPTRRLAQLPLAPGSVSPDVHAAGVVLRMFAVSDGTTISVLPGGAGRVLAPGDDPRTPTACTVKDVWVLGSTVAPALGHRLPQVDFGRSVPTRAADALYWTNRSAERAEAMTRTMRVISSRIDQDPGLATMHGGAWADRMRRLTSMIRRDSSAVLGAEMSVGIDVLHRELSLVGEAVAREIGSLLTEATTVREYLSVTTGRVLSHLAELRSSLQRHLTMVDDLDAILADFAAIAGLWQESTVRGPAWRIGDTGRRLERCLVVLDLIDGSLDPSPDDSLARSEVDASAVEVLLAANDSLVAYRRRYRSDVEIDAALHLMVNDQTNPRSLAASIDRLAQHAANGEPALGDEFVERARASLEQPVHVMVPELRSIVTQAGARVVSRWFSTPVNPIVMRPTEQAP
ncbi:MAG TPA: circularly permuted type 2 ATP-grasp protein [Ilumatobacter sp.]|nr:circularly permuted type 2 ATP-grasp protein [Ilumatobacter sp.]